MVELPPPARYKPWLKGVYEVAPNLRPFGTDFGNGELDQKLFQFDSDWPRYLESKRAALEEDPSKYVARLDLPPEVETAVVALMGSRLLEEWPSFVPPEFSLDGICRFVQEDLAIVVRDEARDWIAYINVCNPSHWLPTEKIGLSFFDAHVPVPGFERVNAAAKAMVDSMIHRGPFVRFVWGLESDDQLNHHPVPPVGRDQAVWYGRRFDEGLFVRVERQVLWPLPEVSAALFSIRPIVYSAESVRADAIAWEKLVQAVQGMSAEALAYKGIPEGLLSER